MSKTIVNPNLGSNDLGSPAVPSLQPDQNKSGGETVKTGDNSGEIKDDNKKGGPNSKEDYAELASRLGAQGQELGEYRQFFQNLSPLLDKLDQSPELVQAIIDGKVSKDVVQSILDGKVNAKEVANVQQAKETVKKNIGEKAYDSATPEAISKLVKAEVSKVRKEFEEKADLKTFQDYSQNFIEKTPDFQEYAEEIDKWLDSHDVTDIEVAYYAVKGQMSEAKAKKVAEEAAAKKAKELMSNASGGGISAQFAPDGTAIVDKLIAGRPNPNTFFSK